MNMPSFSIILSLTVLLWISHTCSAETSCSATRPYYVRPQQPTIVSEPMDKAVHQEVLRSTIKIECVVQIQSIISGWWPCVYWRHNGSVVNSTWPAMARIDTNFWNFSVLHTPFPGSYQCVVDDGSFVLVSREAQISLLSIYPDPNPPLWHSVEACHGQMLHLSCQPVTAGYQAQVIWRKNGLVLPDSQQYIILQPGGPGDLVIYNFSQRDVGNYSCITGYRHIITGHSVTQSTKSCRSWSDIHVVASREYIQQGENLFLVCLTRAANIRFTWFKEGKLLTIPVAGPGVLQVSNTSDSDLGNYTCRATTDNASAVGFASIIVRRFENVSVTAPPFDGWLVHSANGLVDSSITLTCAATGSPPVVTAWFHNGRPVQGNKSIIIHSGINATQAFGMYQCFVKNLHSEAHRQFRVKLKFKPNPPGIVTQHVVSSGIKTELILNWLPPEDLLPQSAVQYLRVSGGASGLEKQLASRVSSTKVTLTQHYTYQFYIEASTTSIDESQWALFSSKGNVSDPFFCCSPGVIGNGSVDDFSCEAEYTYINDTVRCDFQFTHPDACKDGSQSTVSVFCPNGFKGFVVTHHNQRTVHDNASIDRIPCNMQCKVSVSTKAWDVRTSNPITCQDRTNQTFTSASIAPSQPAVINRWNKSCSGTDLVLFVSIPSQICGNATWYSVHYNNFSSRHYQLLDYEKDMKLNISLPDQFQRRNLSLSVVYGNSGGASPLSNTVQVPGITQDDVQNCIHYDCQQKPDEIYCSLEFPKQWTLTEFKNVTFTFLDCNVLRQSQIPCSLEMEGCNSVGNDTVSVEANPLVIGTFPSTCPAHTYCIIAHVAMESGKSVYLNSTARCNSDCSKVSKPCSASRSSSSTSAPTNAVMSSPDTNYIMYILIAGLILLVVILLVIMAVIGGYCIGRKKQSNDMLESLRTISSLQESIPQSNLGTSADGRNDSLPDGDQYYLQSTVHPDDTTQICPVDGSQTDLTSQWVEEQQRLADESEESDVDESRPLLSADQPSIGSRVTSSPRPNHPDGSSQIKDLDSSERASYQYVQKLLTRNVMQQQPSQLSGQCHTNYVELQGCRTRTEQSQPTETSTSFAGASGQLLFSASSPYIPDGVFGSRDDNRSSGPLTSLEDDEESLGPSLLSASNFSMQPSPSPTATCPNGYISVPHSTVAVDCIHDLNTKKGILRQKMYKRDIFDATVSPPGPALPSWSPPSLFGTNSMNLNSDKQ